MQGLTGGAMGSLAEKEWSGRPLQQPGPRGRTVLLFLNHNSPMWEAV